ncbi:ABC transporter ATP-binding protein [Corallococcus sp. AB018]|uniref:ABC transporter ATP-binding protein n=1 Tax=Corallococcus TaxID=83461 RepID=UPI000F87A7AE|nr:MULTISPECIES: ABC transporter ATP-binding protein [Corallococcus]NRD53176.1 ABC transporter ATP-binding protein [Corallococcus exiguus]RUO92470.1 ABC transporter ATP-binding protein [Corallococcus sp. AB018]
MTSAIASPDAIVLRNVVKSFRKSTIRREYTTIKSELIRLLRGQRDTDGKSMIEALRGIDLVVPRGKTVGIIGRNGSGKSTLLKLISGIYTPTTGTIDINGRISALLDLGAGFHPDFSGRENILINGIILGMSRAEVKARMEEIISFSELGDFIDEPVRTYSSGMYMRLAFSVATHVDPDILIIDEILAVGDEHFGKKSLAKMTEFKRAGKTIVIVTHDLGTLERWCDLGAWIDAGRIREFGPPADVIRSYRRAVALAEERGMSMEAPALASDGGALPSLAAPQADPSPLTVDAVRLLGRDGAAVEFVDTEDGLELSVAYTARTPAPELGLGLELSRADGVLVHATDTFAEEVPFCAAAAGSGTVRFVVDRLGLTAGRYAFTVVVRDRAGQVLEKREAVCSFEVRSSVRDGGLTRPPHRWIVEGAAARVAPVRDVGS